jgi:hypothetical protein
MLSLDAVTTLLKEKMWSFKLSWDLEADDWPDSMNFTYGESGIKEMTEKFNW